MRSSVKAKMNIFAGIVTWPTIAFLSFYRNERKKYLILEVK
jgi:hypothetical protein